MDSRAQVRRLPHRGRRQRRERATREPPRDRLDRTLSGSGRRRPQARLSLNRNRRRSCGDGAKRSHDLPDAANIFEKGGARAGLTYYIFDVLELDDVDLTKFPLEQRKALLEKLVGNGDSLIRYSRHFEGDGPHILEHACRLGCEGIVSKRRGDRYRGGRSESWLKTKCVQRREFVIGGYTDPEGSRVGIGSLLLGLRNDAGGLVFAGNVGTGKGFTADYLTEVRRGLSTIEQAACPFAQVPPADVVKRAHWVRPVLSARCRSSSSPKTGTSGIRAFWDFAQSRTSVATPPSNDAPKCRSPGIVRVSASRRKGACVARRVRKAML